MPAITTPFDLAKAANRGHNDIPDPGDAGTINVTRSPGICRLTSGSSGETRTLAVPTGPGLLFILMMETDGGGDITLTVTNGYDQAGSTSLTIDDAGDSVLFYSVTTAPRTYEWRLAGGGGGGGGVASSVDLDGLADGLVLDADGDTTLSAPTDDQIDVEVGGADVIVVTATATTFAATNFPVLPITDTDGTVEGSLWYDASEDKLKFKTAAGVETITSA